MVRYVNVPRVTLLEHVERVLATALQVRPIYRGGVNDICISPNDNETIDDQDPRVNYTTVPNAIGWIHQSWSNHDTYDYLQWNSNHNSSHSLTPGNTASITFQGE